jgi:HK97 family phage portal protein
VSLFGRQARLFGISGTQDLLALRSAPSGTGSVYVTPDTAMRHSAVWACLRLRANLVSTLPVDVFRRVAGIQVEMSKPPVLITPGGKRVAMAEWMYSSQVDLDRSGNSFGLITARNAAGLPAQIELQALSACSVTLKSDGALIYRIHGKEYPPEQVWHEKQYTISGLPVGLSPVAYAAWSIGQYQSAQQFAVDWYGSGGIPKAMLRNTEETVDPKVALEMKARFKAAVEGRDVFTTGKDWEYLPIQAESVGADWLEAQKYGIGDVARFFDCPGDLIDAAVQSGNITYANVTQRNLQFLIMHLGPAIIRRELALGTLLPQPRFVKLNTNALLRMDPQTQALVTQTKIDSRSMTPDEARELDDRPPLTEEQMAQFERLFTQRRISETVQAGADPQSLVTDGATQ